MRQRSKEARKTGTPTALFFSMGIDMSWRLALSVLVPVIGGAELDNVYGTTPVLLIIGFVVAIALSIVTIRRTLKLSSRVEFIRSDKQEPPRD